MSATTASMPRLMESGSSRPEPAVPRQGSECLLTPQTVIHV